MQTHVCQWLQEPVIFQAGSSLRRTWGILLRKNRRNPVGSVLEACEGSCLRIQQASRGPGAPAGGSPAFQRNPPRLGCKQVGMAGRPNAFQPSPLPHTSDGPKSGSPVHPGTACRVWSPMFSQPSGNILSIRVHKGAGDFRHLRRMSLPLAFLPFVPGPSLTSHF